MERYAVILAGGGGTRFWPLSRQNSPKQLLKLNGNDALINETINRLDGCIKLANICVATNKSQEQAMKNVLNNAVLSRNIILEPISRNTAPSILLSAMFLKKRYGNVVMCVLPSDHYIGKENAFRQILSDCIYFAEQHKVLITIGVKPTFAATGYGYINFSNQPDENEFYKVVEFTEKPDFMLAERYFSNERYLWNSGIFIWQTDAIIENFARFLPRIFEKLNAIYRYLDTEQQNVKINDAFEKIQAISIDYGILERSNDVFVILGDFGWNDVGSWDSLGSIYAPDMEGNIIKADHLGIDTTNTIIYGNEKLIATIGLKNMIVVSTEDATLICPKDKAQDVKKLVDKLKENNRMELI